MKGDDFDVEADGFAMHLRSDLSSLSEQVASNHRNLEDLVGHTSREFSDQQGRLRAEHGQQLNDLEQKALYLSDVIAEVENIPTRRVDWLIKDAAQQIQKLATRSDLVLCGAYVTSLHCTLFASSYIHIGIRYHMI